MSDTFSPAVPAPVTPRFSPAFASWMLVLVTLCWGMSFTLIKNWQDESTTCPGGTTVASLTMIAVRMALALVVLGVLQPQLFVRPTRRAHRAGFLIGMAFFAGFALQVQGLARTTPARSGFLTSLSSALVPVAAWLLLRTRVARLTLFGLAIGMAGAGLLSLSGTTDDVGRGVNLGDILTIVAATFFTLQVILVDRLGRTVEPAHVSVSFFATCGAGALLTILVLLAVQGTSVVSWLEWLGEMLRKPYMPAKMGALVIFCTVLAFHGMNTFQPCVPASRAALIYLLESVFSSAISVALGYDPLTWPLVLGGGMILGGNLLVELPTWWRERMSIKEERGSGH